MSKTSQIICIALIALICMNSVDAYIETHCVKFDEDQKCIECDFEYLIFNNHCLYNYPSNYINGGQPTGPTGFIYGPHLQASAIQNKVLESAKRQIA